MSDTRRPRDPFGSPADPSAYVQREETERALEALQVALLIGKRVIALTGPPGIGKTMLLRVLAQRVQRAFRCIYLPYAALPPADICAWLLGLLEEPTPKDPTRDLIKAVHRLRGDHKSNLVVMIDDASALPAATVTGLASLLEEANGAIRLILAPVDDFRSGRVLAPVAHDLEEVRFTVPMSRDETETYVRGRLDWARAPDDVRSRFDERTIQYLHRVSQGLPRVLNLMCGEVLRGSFAVMAANLDGELEQILAEEAPHEGLQGPSPLEEEDAVPAPGTELVLARKEPKPRPGPQRSQGAPAPEEPVEERLEEDEVGPEDEEDEFGEASGVSGPFAIGDDGTLLRQRRRIVQRAPGLPMIFGAVLAVGLLAIGLPWLRGIVVVPSSESVPAPAPAPATSAAVFPGQAVPRASDPVPAPLVEPTEPVQLAPSEPVAPVVGEVPVVREVPVVPLEPVVAEDVPAPVVPPDPLEAREPAPADPPGASSPGLIRVHINATPWARIAVDGISVGVTPLADVPLVTGSHTVSARMADGTLLVQVIEVDEEHRHFSFP